MEAGALGQPDDFTPWVKFLAATEEARGLNPRHVVREKVNPTSDFHTQAFMNINACMST